MITFTNYKCAACKGNVIVDDGVLTCIMCNRTFKNPQSQTEGSLHWRNYGHLYNGRSREEEFYPA